MKKISLVGISIIGAIFFSGCANNDCDVVNSCEIQKQNCACTKEKEIIKQNPQQIKINISVTSQNNKDKKGCCLDVDAPIEPYMDDY